MNEKYLGPVWQVSNLFTAEICYTCNSLCTRNSSYRLQTVEANGIGNNDVKLMSVWVDDGILKSYQRSHAGMEELELHYCGTASLHTGRSWQ